MCGCFQIPRNIGSHIPTSGDNLKNVCQAFGSSCQDIITEIMVRKQNKTSLYLQLILWPSRARSVKKVVHQRKPWPQGFSNSHFTRQSRLDFENV